MSSLVDNYSKEELEEIVYNSFTFKEVIDKLGYKTHNGHNHDTVKKRLEHYGISTEHFICNNHINKVNEEEVFIENSPVSRKTLKSRFIKIVDYKCAICGLTEWNNKPITLTIDHINGINNDNRIENLRLLCPNCDSQQSTYRGANKCKH